MSLNKLPSKESMNLWTLNYRDLQHCSKKKKILGPYVPQAAEFWERGVQDKVHKSNWMLSHSERKHFRPKGEIIFLLVLLLGRSWKNKMQERQAVPLKLFSFIIYLWRHHFPSLSLNEEIKKEKWSLSKAVEHQTLHILKNRSMDKIIRFLLVLYIEVYFTSNCSKIKFLLVFFSQILLISW